MKEPVRGALCAFLRQRRAALKPEDHGVVPHYTPTGRRAQGGGLSQPQVDALCHFSKGTYQSIESGRKTAPEHALRQVAGLFRFTEQEWTWVWHLMHGHNPPRPLRPVDDEEIPGSWVRLIEGSVFPCYITNARFDILAHNTHLPGFFPDGAVPDNTMEWMLLDPVAREDVLIDWETQWAPLVVPQLWAARAEHRDDDYLADLEQRVLADKHAGPIYNSFGDIYAHPDGACRPYRHPTLGPGWVQLHNSCPRSSPGRFITMTMIYDPGESPPEPAAPIRYRRTAPRRAHT